MKNRPIRKGFYNEKDDLPDYKPNYELVQRRIGSAVPKFETLTGRQPQERKPETLNEDLYNYDYFVKNNKSNLYRR